MNEIPVPTRTQRRFERRQLFIVVILMAATAVASFFLGVMVGERGGFPSAKADPPRLPMVQVAPPPLPVSAPAGPQKLTFYDDLPKGNSAPLGSGINLPKGGYAYSVPAPPPPATPAAAAAPVAVASAPAPAVETPVAKAPPAVAPPPAPVAAPRVSAGGAYVVQVAATRDQAEAKRLVDKLKGKGFAATSERADLGAKGIWFRVTAGPYGDQATAESAAVQLKQQKFSAIVRKK